MSLQLQLHPEYNFDEQLHDRLMNAVDVSSIQDALHDRTPRKYQQLLNMVVNRIGSQKRTAGTSSASIAQDAKDRSDSETHVSMYTLGQQYGGEARQTLKTYVVKRTTSKSKRTSYYNQSEGRQCKPRRLSSSWMRGEKVCFRCGKSHRANDRRPREYLTAADDNSKAKLPPKLIPVSAMAFVVDLSATGDQTKVTEDEIEAEWAEKEEEDTERSLVVMATDDVANI